MAASRSTGTQASADARYDGSELIGSPGYNELHQANKLYADEFFHGLTTEVMALRTGVNTV